MENTSQSSERNSSSSALMDSSSPYYLHPSDSPRMNLVNFVFDGTGFAAWRRSIIISLSAKNKMSFIDGSAEIPSANTPEFKFWTRFGQSNKAQLYHLQKGLTDLMLGTTDVAGYFTRIKRIWNDSKKQYTHDVTSPKCESCVLSPHSNEKQREAFVNPNFLGDTSSFLATYQNFSGQRYNNTDFRARNNNNNNYNNNLYCTNYKKSRHSIAKCYRIIGYPPDFKFTKGLKSQPNNKGNSMANAVTTDGYSGYTTNGKQANGSVAQENYGGLEEEFQNAYIGDVPFAGSEVSANMVHYFSGNNFSDPRLYQTHASSSYWILDSGASAHMSFDPAFFTSLTLLSSYIYVKLPNSFRGHSIRTPLVIGEAKDGIYIMNTTSVLQSLVKFSSKSDVLLFSCSSFPSYFSILVNNRDDVKLWHIRLGHMPFDSMKNISFSSSFSHFDHKCDICPVETN
ncbi:uncharacterized protein LOC129892931 [Solanum dulcamara]|uniref:uncharacterized protein LOC129892931 n=1 Tax=Solanum dulcamara TaxID=45834 RepID=UPI002485B4BD|nr:uncharacterized protein LOC129892931 [Solanum dulcamara]